MRYCAFYFAIILQGNINRIGIIFLLRSVHIYPVRWFVQAHYPSLVIQAAQWQHSKCKHRICSIQQVIFVPYIKLYYEVIKFRSHRV